MKYVPPSVCETAFNCPHCGALAKQFWFGLATVDKDEKYPLPLLVDEQSMKDSDLESIQNEQEREEHRTWLVKMVSGEPFRERREKGAYSYYDLFNVSVSECFNCRKNSLWVYDKLYFPYKGEVPPANPDMPDDIRQDYNEAGSILNQSPRGAAALIRLAIQKLCKVLGQEGKNINDDIKTLVAKGLDPRVQQALDAVRVIGNSAVHPGQIDLRDDRPTAETLFRLLNLIVDKTISEPKHVAEVYNSLSPSILKAIAERDSKS
ncbi:DUF4145 domain-containing protein [Pseudomonas sp. OA65]|uniref:DUF4145 domain-containing protein n=1 Tax=Pseudomonas sp. OA65 TaxID=2818431 RepID=UPI001FB10D0B|nr:DUF4145 domain-containing protein [Pseudomonas sp. OA65]